MGKKKEKKKADKARRKEEKARKKEEKRRLEAEEAALRAAEEEAELEARERALLRRARKPAKPRAPRPAPRAARPSPKPAPKRTAPPKPAAKPAPKRPAPPKPAPKPPKPARPTRPASPRPLRTAQVLPEPTVAAEPEAAETATAARPEVTEVIEAPPPVRPGEDSFFDDEVEDSPDERLDSPEEVEARLDRFLRQSMPPAAAERAREILSDGAERLAERLGQEPGAARSASVLDSARDLLSSDTYLRALGQLRMRGRSIEVDEYGLDPKVEARWQPFFDFLYGTYWRVRVKGVHNIPDTGRCLLVANHSGTIPYDGAMIKTAVLREHAARRPVRWLAEDFVFHFPFIGAFMNRIGAVRACQENAERMLLQERLVAVFPEGIKGIGKLYKERYKLQRFGRGGYVKLVLRTGAPIVPVAVVGAEEIHPLLLRGRTLANMIGMPYIPVTPTFPLLGPLGLVPLPSQWLIEFGEPIAFEGHGPEDADDPLLVNRLNDGVRARIQGMVDGLLAERAALTTTSASGAG